MLIKIAYGSTLCTLKNVLTEQEFKDANWGCDVKLYSNFSNMMLGANSQGQWNYVKTSNFKPIQVD